MSGQIILISGPVRSGKSSFAEQTAAKLACGGCVAYIATSQAFDEEMKDRILRHQRQRPSHWQTYEAPFEPWKAMQEAYAKGQRIFLLDCLTMLVTNWLNRALPDPDQVQLIPDKEQAEIEQVITNITQTVMSMEDATLIVVTNEVGWGIVPDYALGRLYRDLAGRTNQLLAKQAREVWLIVMGLPLQLK